MPQVPGQDDAPDGPAQDSVAFEKFSGLRNTVLPERLSKNELARGRDVDIDDAGEMRRRRGQTVVLTGNWHSLFQAKWFGNTYTFGVNGETLCLILPGFVPNPMLGGMPPDHLSWVQVGVVVYFSSRAISGQIDLSNGLVSPWGFRTAHSYYPQTTPITGQAFWMSPVTEPDATLAPVAGKLLGPVPMAEFVTYFQGRIYLAVDNVLWATELYLYNYVDKTAGYRQFEDKITGMAAVDDGLYVGTKSGLYFVSGTFKEQRRMLKERSGVIPGTMIVVPGETVNPEGRERPDIPHESEIAISCMTTDGLVVGLKGGTTYNLTRNQFMFPNAVRGTSTFRSQDGIKSILTVLDSGGGTPETSQAAFGDYVTVSQIRNGQVIGTTTSLPYAPPKPQPPIITFANLEGQAIASVSE